MSIEWTPAPGGGTGAGWYTTGGGYLPPGYGPVAKGPAGLPAPSDLAEFLLARIAEDEDEARMWAEREVRWPSRRTLVDCEAKRQIVQMLDNVIQSFAAQNGGPGRAMWTDVNRRERHHANETLYRLALPYADHPDYRQEWTP